MSMKFPTDPEEPPKEVSLNEILWTLAFVIAIVDIVLLIGASQGAI